MWPPLPPPAEPPRQQAQQADWDQQTAPLTPNWQQPPAQQQPPQAYPPQPQQQPHPQQQQYPQQQYPQQQYPQQQYPQQNPAQQQYGPPHGQASAPPHAQASAPPHAQASAPPHGQASAPPYGQAQTSGGPYWTGGPSGAAPVAQPMPTPIPPQPTPGSWNVAQVAASVPTSPQPVQSSWPPVGSPTSGPPQQSWNSPVREEPIPALGDVNARPSGSRALVWTLVAAVIVAVLAGVGGYFLGAGSKDQAGNDPVPGPSASASPSLGTFERAQATLNKAKFDGDLLPLATPWLADMGGCATNTDTGGPKLPSDETKHVFCRHGGVSVHFAQYASQTERDAGRAFRIQLSVTSPGLAPGQGAPGPKTGGSGATGQYVEYALKESDGRALCGIWWNRDDGNAAVFMEALCEEVLGGDWQPFRDLWQRHS